MVTSTVNGKIYAIGGGANVLDDVALQTVEMYEPESDSWTKKTGLPTARIFLSTSVVNGKIYAIGGWNGGPRAEMLRNESHRSIGDTTVDRWLRANQKKKT